MSAPKSPTPVTLPADVQDIHRLHVELVESRQARPSIESVLEAAGELYVGPGGVGRLASRAAYLRAMQSFCAKVGLAPESLNPRRSRSQYDTAAATQALNDRMVAKQLAEMRGSKP